VSAARPARLAGAELRAALDGAAGGGPARERAWEALLPEVRRRLARWCRERGEGPLTDREDVVADVCALLLRRLPRAWPLSRARGVDPEAFLWRVLVLAYVDVLRTRLGRASGPHEHHGFWTLSLDVPLVSDVEGETFAEALPDPAEGPEQVVIARDALRRLWAVATPGERAVLSGRIRGESFRAIGAALGITESGAYMRSRRMAERARAA
jgi:DNA-directed RNA polymerase specialized sigma24 family protein